VASRLTQAEPRGRLRQSDCRGEGIVRLGAGRGFSYRDADGERVEDDETLARIRELAIPPAWKEVWVCPDPLGHLQATGIDAAGRKHYLYHERWQQRQAERKFETVRRFAAALPRLRRAVTADLRLQGMPRERALACAVRLLDLGFFRVGGEVYAEENESFGLATVRREHVAVKDGEVVFDFPAKSGQRRVQSIRDPTIQRAIERMRRRPAGRKTCSLGVRAASGATSAPRTSIPTSRRRSARTFRPRTSAPGTARCWRRSIWPVCQSPLSRLPQSGQSQQRSIGSPRPSATPPPSAAAPTSTRG